MLPCCPPHRKAYLHVWAEHLVITPLFTPLLGLLGRLCGGGGWWWDDGDGDGGDGDDGAHAERDVGVDSMGTVVAVPIVPLYHTLCTLHVATRWFAREMDDRGGWCVAAGWEGSAQQVGGAALGCRGWQLKGCVEAVWVQSDVMQGPGQNQRPSTDHV